MAIPKTVSYQQILQAEKETGLPRDQIIKYIESKGGQVPDARQVLFPGTNVPVMQRGGTIHNILSKTADYAPGVVGTVGGITGSIGGRPGRVTGATIGATQGKALQQQIRSLLGEGQPPMENVKELGQTAQNTFLGTSAIELTLWGGGKLLQPVKNLLSARASAASQYSGSPISGDKLVEAGQKAVNAAPGPIRDQVAKFATKDAVEYAGKNYTIPKALELKSFSNQAFSKAGDLKSGAANFYNKFVGDALRQQIATVAPEVAKYDTLLHNVAYPVEKFSKKLIYPALTGGAIYGALRTLGLSGGGQ